MAWRVLGTLLALASLMFSVPAALWACVIVIATIVHRDGYPPPVWADTVGWVVMLAVWAVTMWVVYRLWKPYLMEMK